MPYNGFGVYSAPATDLPVSGQVISSTKMNNLIADYSSALSLCLLKDGQQVWTAYQNAGGQGITGLGNGSVLLPALRFSTGLGIYSTGSDNVSIAVGGVQALSVSSSGITANIDAANLTSGTIPDARFPATLPALSGVNLTDLNASNLASGVVPAARVGGAYTGITSVGTLTSLTVADDLAVNADTAQARVHILGGDSTYLRLARMTGGTDEKNWLFIFDGSALRLSAYDDVLVTSGVAMQLSRTGTTITKVTFNANAFEFAATYDNTVAIKKASAGTYNYITFYTGDVNRGYIGANPNNVLELGSLGSEMTFYANGGIAFRLFRAGSNGSIFYSGAFTERVSVPFSTTPTFDAAQSNYFELGTLTANVTSMTIANPSVGQTVTIRVKEDGTGGWTVAVPSGAKVIGAASTAANAASLLTLTYTGDARWEGSWLGLPA